MGTCFSHQAWLGNDGGGLGCPTIAGRSGGKDGNTTGRQQLAMLSSIAMIQRTLRILQRPNILIAYLQFSFDLDQMRYEVS